MMNSKQTGFIVPSMIITVTFILLIAVSVFQLVTNSLTLASQEEFRVNAQFAVDAGADYGISQLNADETWTGVAETEYFNDGRVRNTFEATVVDISPQSKTLAVIGRSYSPVTDTSPRTERSYSIDLRGLGGSGGTFAIVTGVGGLIMENSSKIVDGDVYVNGAITMSNSAQIGTTANSVSVKAAHNNCPTSGGPTYPVACTGADGQPISISNSATIYGEVCGNNQTSSSGIDTSGTNGLYQVGVDSECGPANPIPVLPLPDHDRAAQQAAVATTVSSNYYTNCNTNGAVRTWPANLRIVGNVTIQRSCRVIVEGDVWISGSLTIANSAQLVVSDSINLAGTVDGDRPSVMVDGATGVRFRNSSRATSNAAGVGFQLVTYWSDATCSPDCADVTGVNLFTSSNVPTIYLEQSAQAPDSILYAKWSQVDLNNGGDIGALVGQTVKLRNSAAVTFGASVSGGGGGSPAQTWLVENYRRTFD